MALTVRVDVGPSHEYGTTAVCHLCGESVSYAEGTPLHVEDHAQRGEFKPCPTTPCPMSPKTAYRPII